MTVVHLLPALEQGGVESVVCDLSRALVAAGHVSVVISRGGRLVDRVTSAGGTHYALDLKSKNPLTAFFRALKLRRLLADILALPTSQPLNLSTSQPLNLSTSQPPNLSTSQPPNLPSVLVCAHSRVPAWLFAIANRSLHLPWITYAHGANSVSFYSSVMTRGDLVVCPSRFLADFLKANYRFDYGKLRVVNPPVDTARFDPAGVDRSVVESLRQEWQLALSTSQPLNLSTSQPLNLSTSQPPNLSTSPRVLMAVGRVTPVKGYDALIRDFAAGKYDFDRLVIVGDADRHHVEYLEKLKGLAAELKAPVVFAGSQSKIPECLSLADTVISANVTKPESFGLSVAEAYAMNKPVIAKRFGGVAEIMEAVERHGGDYRSAIVDLYGLDRLAEKTLAVYGEIACTAVGKKMAR